jgi:hypothetical protein
MVVVFNKQVRLVEYSNVGHRKLQRLRRCKGLKYTRTIKYGRDCMYI